METIEEMFRETAWVHCGYHGWVNINEDGPFEVIEVCSGPTGEDIYVVEYEGTLYSSYAYHGTKPGE